MQEMSTALWWSSAVSVFGVPAGRRDVLVFGMPFLGLKVWVLEVCRIEVRTAQCQYSGLRKRIMWIKLTSGILKSDTVSETWSQQRHFPTPTSTA